MSDHENEVIQESDHRHADHATAAGSVAVTPKRSEERCNAIPYRDLCILLERMTKEHGSIAKLKLLFNQEFKKYIQNGSIFPILRLILPANDTERGKYGLKQAAIAKTYVAALHLDKESEDAKRLLNWKDPTKSQGIDLSKNFVSGDFGSILEEVLKPRISSEYSTLTIGDINTILTDLANAVTVEDKVNLIKHRVLDRLNHIEQKWLVRIIFQDLKVGLKHENVLGAFYPSALKRYNECTNLRTVCEEEGTIVEHSGIQLFVHFSPMLAKGYPNSSLGQVGAVEQAMNSQPFVMDLKLDGERILCHIGEDNSYILYTRRGNDYTENYWPVAHDIISCLRKRGKFSCILDGEILAINGSTKAHLPFGHNLTVARGEREYGENKQNIVGWHTQLTEWMMFYVFDINYLDGPDSQHFLSLAAKDCGFEGIEIPSGEISQLPLIFRRKLLQYLLQPEPDRVEFIPCQYVVTTDLAQRKKQLEEYFNEVTIAGKEGLVIKNLTSTYELGEKSRSTSYWVKMKPEYGDHAADLDLLILGGYYGEGQNLRGQGISTFLCGVKDDNNPNLYQTLCKVGTGYSFNQLTELRDRLKEIEIPWNPRLPPEHLSHWKIAKPDDRPNVYYPPDQSIVLQLKCAEIVESISFSCGLTCRFPRVQRIRYDKFPHEILSVRDVVAAKDRPRNTVNSMGGEGGEGGEGGGGAKKKGRGKKGEGSGTTTGRKKELAIDNQFKLEANLQEVNIDGELFRNETFCVLENEFSLASASNSQQATSSTSTTTTVGGGEREKSWTRTQIMELIKKQGGTIVANAAYPGCKVVAGNKKTLQLKNIIDQGEKDVIDFRYLIDCINANRKLPLRRFYFLNISSQTLQALRGQDDLFGDSFTEDIDEHNLLNLFHNIDHMIDLIERKKNPKVSLLAKKRKLAATQENLIPSGPSPEELLAVENWKSIRQSYFGWRHLADHFLAIEEREPLFHPGNAFYHDRVIIYLDMYSDLGRSQATEKDRYMNERIDESRLDTTELDLVQMAQLKTAYGQLISRGALVAHCLHSDVTHVVMIPHKDRFEKIQERIRSLRLAEQHSYEKRIVSILWVNDCMTAKEIIEPLPEHMVTAL